MSFIELVAQRHPPKPPAGMQPPPDAKDWFRMEATPNDDDSTDIYVYESIGGWFGMWAEDFIYQLKDVTTSKINLRLNSPGGSVFDGIAIANALRAHPANVTVYVDSLAASIASVIALAGDRVVMMPQSQFMVHNASGACYGDATEMTKMADLLDKQSRNIAEAYAQHTGGTLAEWQDYMAAETWFTAEEAVAVGLADEVVPMRQEAPAEDEAVAARMQRSWDLSMYQHAGREQAPAPKIAQPVAIKMELKGADLTEPLREHVRRINAVAETVTLPSTTDLQPVGVKLVSSPGVLSNMSQEDLVALIRDAVREELTAQAVAAPEDAAALDDSPAQPSNASTPPPDEGEEEEDEDPPPFEEDPNDQAGQGDPPPPDPADTGPGGDTETPNEADAWNQVVGFLVSTATSPSADDVFAQLKEGW